MKPTRFSIEFPYRGLYYTDKKKYSMEIGCNYFHLYEYSISSNCKKNLFVGRRFKSEIFEAEWLAFIVARQDFE